MRFAASARPTYFVKRARECLDIMIITLPDGLPGRILIPAFRSTWDTENVLCRIKNKWGETRLSRTARARSTVGIQIWTDACIGVNIWIVAGIGSVIFALLNLLIGKTAGQAMRVFQADFGNAEAESAVSLLTAFAGSGPSLEMTADRIDPLPYPPDLAAMMYFIRAPSSEGVIPAFHAMPGTTTCQSAEVISSGRRWVWHSPHFRI